MREAPKVSIGMPVYNGERFLAEAIESILVQTFSDFELIISDNASTDNTAEICHDYTRRDGRVTYHRQPENVGAARNYNAVVRLARGTYFKWAAHDDMIAPTFLEACLAGLDRDPTVAIAFARMREIDEAGATLGDYDAPIVWDGRSPSSRFESLLCTPPDQTYIHRCVPITGVMRAEILRQTRLIGPFPHADKVAIVELALLGNLVEVPAPLFLRRRHAGTSLSANPSPIALRRWFDPKARGRIVAPRNRLLFEYFRAVHRTAIGSPEKAACIRSIVRRVHRDWRILGGEMRRALFSPSDAV